MTKICSIWVPHCLTDDQKAQRVMCAQNLLIIFSEQSQEDILKQFIIEDETCVTFSPQPWRIGTKVWHTKGTGGPKVARIQQTAKKTLLLLAFTGDGKFCLKSNAPRETVNAEYYCDFVQSTLDKFRRERTSKRVPVSNNASSHAATLTTFD